VSVYCNGCRGFGAGPIGTPSVGPALILEVMLYARGCLICSTANATSDRRATRVSILEKRIIFLEPKVSVSSRKTNAEPAARRVNQSRPIEKARISCEITAAKRGTRLVGRAPCLVTCGGAHVSKMQRLKKVDSWRDGRRRPGRGRCGAVEASRTFRQTTYHQQ
jgi:hypothetical protein